MESIGIIQLAKLFYDNKLTILLAALVVGAGAGLTTALTPETHQAVISIRLTEEAASIFSQSIPVAVVRGEDISENLADVGSVKIVYPRNHTSKARVTITGQSSSRAAAVALAKKAARSFVEKTTLPMNKGVYAAADTVDAIDTPKPLDAIPRAISLRIALGIISGAGLSLMVVASKGSFSK